MPSLVKLLCQKCFYINYFTGSGKVTECKCEMCGGNNFKSVPGKFRERVKLKFEN